MSGVTRLEAALERVEGFFRAQGAPIADLVRPGLSDDELDEQARAWPYSLPAEVRTWFRWHNGCEQPPEVQSTWPFLTWNLSFAEGVEDARLIQQWQEQDRDNIHERIVYEARWLPLFNASPGIEAVDTSVSFDASAPVHDLHVMAEDWRVPIIGSLTELAELWVHAIDAGWWRWDDEAGDWADHFQQLPPEMRVLGLV
jgi:hypothetical protein